MTTTVQHLAQRCLYKPNIKPIKFNPATRLFSRKFIPFAITQKLWLLYFYILFKILWLFKYLIEEILSTSLHLLGLLAVSLTMLGTRFTFVFSVENAAILFSVHGLFSFTYILVTSPSRLLYAVQARSTAYSFLIRS